MAPVSDQARTAAPQPIAVCRRYDDLRRAIVAFCADNGITRQELDARAALADGHSAKLLAPRTVRRAIRRFGNVSFGRVLEALGLEIVLQVRPDAAEAVAREKLSNRASDNASEQKTAPQDWRRNRGSAWGRRMAARRALSQTAEQRRASARKAAQARWGRRQSTTAPGTSK